MCVNTCTGLTPAAHRDSHMWLLLCWKNLANQAQLHHHGEASYGMGQGSQ